MLCTNCQYPLWNLSERACPECGVPFRLAEFEFALRSVVIHCGVCGCDFVAPDSHADLDAPIIRCANCNASLNTDAIALTPRAGHAPPERRGETNPWISERASLRAWWRTLRVTWSQPTALLGGQARAASIKPALIYLVISTATAALILAIQFAWMGWLNITGYGPIEIITVAAVICLFLPPIAALWAVCAHIFIAPAEGSLGDSLKAVFYTSGVLGAAALPCCGLLLAPVMWLLTAAAPFAAVHGITYGRACRALLTFPVIALLCVIVLAGH